MKFPVTIYEVRVSEEVHPVVDIDIERTQQALIFKGTTFKHLLCFYFAGVAEVIHEQSAHLPTVAHLFDHHASDGFAVPIRGSSFEQMALLLAAGKFGVALVDDHVDQRIAHLLRRHLTQVLPLAPPLEVAKLDFFRLDRAEQRVEFEAGNFIVIDANVLAPIVK